MILSLKNGDMYMVYLISDARSVSKFVIEKVGASVITSGIAILSPELFFFGSRLGDSLLVEYHEKTLETNHLAPQPAKRIKLDLDSELYGADDIEAETSVSTSRLHSYTFSVRDSLLNVGPIGDFAVGDPAFLSEEFTDKSFRHLEVVACSGYAKNGALSVLQRNVKPQVVTSFDSLGSCYDLWSILVSHRDVEADPQGFHKFLVISREASTMILELGEELRELEKSSFYVSGPTIHAGSIWNQECIIQVYASGIRLLDARCALLQEVPLDKEFYITACSVAGDFALIQLSNDTVRFLKIDEQKNLSFENMLPLVNVRFPPLFS